MVEGEKLYELSPVSLAWVPLLEVVEWRKETWGAALPFSSALAAGSCPCLGRGVFPLARVSGCRLAS